VTNPDAAWRPRPREPPVTTTTFPLREKMEGKSLSCVSAIVDRIEIAIGPSLLCRNKKTSLEEGLKYII
jgi:hypothetical protein